jgi:hypothetical protein
MAVYSIVLMMIWFSSDSPTITEEPIQTSVTTETATGQDIYIPDYWSNEDLSTWNIIPWGSERIKPFSWSTVEWIPFSWKEDNQITRESLWNSWNSDTGINIELSSWETTIIENTFASWFISGEQIIESWFSNESTWNLDWNTENADNGLAVLYIPDQQTLLNVDDTATHENTNNWTWDWWGTEEWSISIHISDISYSWSNVGNFNWSCFGLWYCLIVEDNNWLLWWYINIDQTPMLSTSNELDDTDLFIDTTNSSLITLNWWSMDARVIPTNGNVNFENDAWHTIISKQRIDGMIWTYALDPSFSILTQHISPWDYNWESVITLYYY